MTSSFDVYKQQVMHFEDGDPNENPWVNGKPVPQQIQIVDYDPTWAEIYAQQRQNILNVMQDKVISIAHVGSTAVPYLAAKPIIDIDLIVADSANENDYLPGLEQLGFKLTIREPSWYQHRMLKLYVPNVNLHIFSPNSPEHLRHLLFRNWLISHPADRQRYVQAKLQANIGVNYVKDYNDNKNKVVREIYTKLFAELDNNLPPLIARNN